MTVGPEPDSLQEWANERGLAFQPEDTLLPVTERLKLGVGVGEHRASHRTVSDRGTVRTTGSNKKRPERETLGLCQGVLPGGLDGEVGHHVHLIDQGKGVEDRYLAVTDTIVFAELPHRARPVFHLGGRKSGDLDIKVGMSVGGKSADEMASPLDGVIPAPHGRVEAGGMNWTSFPAEPDERIRRLASGATRELDGLPVDRIEVEYECGILAVWVKGLVLTDGESLDRLCRFASALADGLGEVTDSSPPPGIDELLPLAAPDRRDEWVSAGVDLVEWDEPPVSIVAAQERYKKDVKPKATRTGWSVYGIVATVLFLFGVLIAAGGLAFSLLTDQLPFGLALFIAVIAIAGGALAANRIALEAGQDAMDDRLSSSSTPWGIEAFARGYAGHSGLARENIDELRHRVAVPFNGRPQITWQGELSPGTNGHLSVWIDATGEAASPRFYLLAVTAPTGGGSPAGFESVEVDGLRLTWQQVTTVQRAVHRLDQLRQAVKAD